VTVRIAEIHEFVRLPTAATPAVLKRGEDVIQFEQQVRQVMIDGLPQFVVVNLVVPVGDDAAPADDALDRFGGAVGIQRPAVLSTGWPSGRAIAANPGE
jgi:hypothetical protein